MATIKGKWIWNKTVDVPAEGIDLKTYIHFISNKENFSSLSIKQFTIPLHVDIFYDNIIVNSHSLNDPGDENGDGDYEVVCEFDESYRMMDFGETEQIIDDDAYEFIIANAIRYIESYAAELKAIAENQQKVYDAGYHQALKLGGYKEGFENGKKSEYDAFWDNYQNYGMETGYVRAFGGDCWTEETFKPKYDLTVKDGYAMFAYFAYRNKQTEEKDFKSLKVLLAEAGVELTFENCSRIGNLFEGAYITELGVMDFSTVNQASPAYVFHGCANLHTIEKIILSNVVAFTYQNWFSSCRALENITFEGEIANDIDFHWSTMLTWGSIANIIAHLSNTAEGKTLTLSKAAVDEAFKFNVVDGDGTIIDTSYGTDEDNPYWWPLRNTKLTWEIEYL